MSSSTGVTRFAASKPWFRLMPQRTALKASANKYVEHMPAEELKKLQQMKGDDLFHYIRSIEAVVMLVTGSWGAIGSYAAVCPGWGHFGGLTQSRKVKFP